MLALTANPGIESNGSFELAPLNGRGGPRPSQRRSGQAGRDTGTRSSPQRVQTRRRPHAAPRRPWVADRRIRTYLDNAQLHLFDADASIVDILV